LTIISGFKWYLNLSFVGATGPESLVISVLKILTTRKRIDFEKSGVTSLVK